MYGTLYGSVKHVDFMMMQYAAHCYNNHVLPPEKDERLGLQWITLVQQVLGRVSTRKEQHLTQRMENQLPSKNQKRLALPFEEKLLMAGS